MNFVVPHQDMVREARSSSSSGKRRGSGRGSTPLAGSTPSMTASPFAAGLALSLPAPPFTTGLYVPPPLIEGLSASAPTVLVACVSIVPQAYDVVNQQEGEDSYADDTVREV
ncbi:hypothetical protein Taro_038861 [Colocasia esculenta]|uniref:Uncharacterized protein n=1 Tax=Colocasia esculenta TaxID=4460 RepID=A0A843W7U0_COLES|nr:hypothetical protein [Colocasia esculenta]